MYIKSFFLFLGTAIVLGACGPSEEELMHTKEETAWSAMMKIHDEVMPKTSEIVSLYTELKKIDPQKITDNEKTAEVQTTIIALEEAEEAMFAWMNELKNLKVLRLQKNHEEIMSYLAQETQIIESISNQMIAALEEGYQVKNKLSL